MDLLAYVDGRDSAWMMRTCKRWHTLIVRVIRNDRLAYLRNVAHFIRLSDPEMLASAISVHPLDGRIKTSKLFKASLENILWIQHRFNAREYCIDSLFDLFEQFGARDIVAPGLSSSRLQFRDTISGDLILALDHYIDDDDDSDWEIEAFADAFGKLQNLANLFPGSIEWRFIVYPFDCPPIKIGGKRDRTFHRNACLVVKLRGHNQFYTKVHPDLRATLSNHRMGKWVSERAAEGTRRQFKRRKIVTDQAVELYNSFRDPDDPIYPLGY